jgi:hypothetical protein
MQLCSCQPPRPRRLASAFGGGELEDNIEELVGEV